MITEYERKKEKIKQNVDVAFEKVTDSEQNLRSLRDSTETSLKQIKGQKERLGKVRSFLNDMPNSPHFTPSIETHEYMDTLGSLMGSVTQYVSYQNAKINSASQYFKGTYASATVTSGWVDSSFNMILPLADEISQSYPKMRETLREYIKPTESEIIDDVEHQLKNINPLLADKFREVFKTFSDKNYMSAAHAMREVLSSLGTELAPKEKVTKMIWYKQDTTTNGPTQHQRIKYAIIGQSSVDIIGEDEIKAIDKLAKEARKIYQKLNPEAHRRTGRWEKENVRQYLLMGQNVIKQILLLRNEFFTENC
ncbi:MAG: hypothetical protein KAT05_16655 [Spirochaetes bacterium]|nr:hypothetical protein [Spirochaetota bacterium]